jgi:hypothetical protein
MAHSYRKRLPITACAAALAFFASPSSGQVRCVAVGEPEAACGVSAHVSQSATFEVAKKRWDPALRSWIFLVRCVHAPDCLPFWAREPSTDVSLAPSASAQRPLSPPDSHTASAMPLLVHPGEAAMLVWDQGGISAVVPAICLDRGAKGESVRARIPASGRIVRAIVLEARRLQVAS